MNQTDPNISALCSARVFLIALGDILPDNGLSHSGAYFWIEMGASSVMIMGPAAWGIWAAMVNLRLARAIGVQAGVTMTAKGRAVDDKGKVISQFATDATPPKSVTVQTANEIVANFGPDPKTIAKA